MIDEYARFGKKLENAFSPDVVWSGVRRRDLHDLKHVLTGYGRDALGEACVLNFTCGQHRGFGLYFIAHMAALAISKDAPKDAPV